MRPDPSAHVMDEANIVMFHVTIVRHGQTIGNVAKIIQGHCDTPLTDLGIAQTQALVKHFRENNLKFNRVYSSDLGRASRTCGIITSSCCVENEVEIVLEKRLRERRYGMYEGRLISELLQEASSHNYDSENFTRYTPEGGETIDQLRWRVADFCSESLWPNAKANDEILIVSHWATIVEFLKLFRPHSNGTIRDEHISETANVAFSRFRIAARELDNSTKDKFFLDITGLVLHQTPHLSEDQVSINLKHRLR